MLRPGVRLSPMPLGLEPDRPTSSVARIMSIAPAFAEEAQRAIKTHRAQQREAQLRQAERVGMRDAAAWGRAPDHADYGPGHQYQRIAGRHARVEVVDSPDPANPRRTVRRARVADPLRGMVLRGSLQARHALAARRFREDVETAGDVYSSRDLMLPGGTGGGCPGPVVATAAARRVERAVLAMIAPPNGLGHLTIFVAIAMERWTIRDLALRLAMRRARLTEVLREAVEALANHYGIEEDATTRRLVLDPSSGPPR